MQDTIQKQADEKQQIMQVLNSQKQKIISL
jgi:hypothetical protein